MTELEETIRDTIRLIEELIENIDYNTITQLDWNLGWKDNIYNTTILEDHYYDTQALTLAKKILDQILEPQEEE